MSLSPITAFEAREAGNRGLSPWHIATLNEAVMGALRDGNRFFRADRDLLRNGRGDYRGEWLENLGYTITFADEDEEFEDAIVRW